MNDNEIVKSIKELISQKEKNGCNDWHVVLSKGSANDLLRYINHLQISLEYKSEEIKRLKAENERLKQNLKEAHSDIKEHFATFKIEQAEEIKQAKTEAMEDLAVKIKKELIKEAKKRKPCEECQRDMATLETLELIDRVVRETIEERF